MVMLRNNIYTVEYLRDKPFRVPEGTIITYYAKDGSHYPQYCVTKAFMSDSLQNITVQVTGDELECTSPLYWVLYAYGKVYLDFPNVEFVPGDVVYNRNNKKFIVSDEEACSRNLTEVYCRIEGEKGVYLIPRKDLSFKSNTEIPGDNTEEFFPSTPTPEQFKAIQELTDLSRDLYNGNSFDKIWIDESESIPNAQGGIKFDSNKARPTLLLKSMPDAVQEVIDVLELGARKYAPDNWKKVENERYHDAMLRHILAYLGGETFDQETSKHHLAHAVCNMLFLIQKESDE